MCVLIIKPAGVLMPPAQTLERCEMYNPHGMGIATQYGIYKTMDFDSFVRVLECVPKKIPALIHFRFATHGSICESNCHPFTDENTGVSFAHNGVLSVPAEGDMTDSETAFRRLLLPVIEQYGLRSKQLKRAVNGIIGGSKFAFITNDGQIARFGHFTNVGGLLYSNLNFMGYGYYGAYNRAAY